MPFTVVYDACVLHPAPLRDLLVRLAAAGYVNARWSDQILDECIRSIRSARRDLKEGQMKRLRSLLVDAVPDCLVTGFENLVSGFTLPDPDDRHVLAAAVRSGAQVIVTFNITDFPSSALAPLGIEAKHPDEFLMNQLDLFPAGVIQVLSEQAADLRKPPKSVAEVLDLLRNLGLVASATRIRALLMASLPP